MSQQPSKKKPISLVDMAPQGVDGRAWVSLLKQQLMSSKEDGEPTDAELLYFAQVARSTGLDPSKREIYGIYRRPNKDSEQKLTIQTGIDGFRVVAERSGKYAGSREYDFEYDENVKITVNHAGTQKRVPNKARATVLKVIEGQIVETSRTANWVDFYPGEGKQGNMWRKIPEIMLGKCAEAQAHRVAFPNDCQNLYLEEEMQAPEYEGNDMETIADKIRKSQTTDELMGIMSELSMDEKKQVTDLSRDKFAELQGGQQ